MKFQHTCLAACVLHSGSGKMVAGGFAAKNSVYESPSHQLEPCKSAGAVLFAHLQTALL